MGRPRKYKTEEERKAAHNESSKRWLEKNKERVAEYQTEWYQTNKDKVIEHQAAYRQKNKERISVRNAEYYSTPYGRARQLISSYKRKNKKYNRGECTLTAQWVVDNIFSKPCHYCGETDWRKIGCDRIDNSKPHTQDNVVPCCYECNNKKQKTPYDEFMKIMGKVV